MKIKIKMLSILLIVIFSLLTACSDSPKQSSQSSSSQSESEKVPSNLTELENNIETIIKTLGGPAVQENKGSGSSQSGQSSSSQQVSGSSQSGQSSSSEQGSQSSQQGQSQSSGSSPNQQDLLTQIAPIVEKMHYQWNNLMSEAIKKGADNKLVNNFGDSLNDLSDTVNSKNKINIMIAANRIYSYIPDLYSLFQAKTSPQIKRIRYYSRNAVLNAETANWKQADSDINSLKSVWVLYKSSLSKEQQDSANKLDLSIYELEKVIKERNQTIVNIKGNIVLSNTQALEKATESGSSQSSEASSSSSQSSGS
jgi:hypothetical protein